MKAVQVNMNLNPGFISAPFLKIAFFKVCEHIMAFLPGSRFAHDLAAFEGLLRARRHTAMAVGLKVIDRQRAIVVPVRVERQPQRRTWLHDPHARMATAMYPALVPFGALEPTCQISMVFRDLGRLATPKHPWLNTAHHLGALLRPGIGAGLPLLPQQDALRLTFVPCGLVARLQSAIHRLEVFDVVPDGLQGVAGTRQSAIHTAGKTRPQ